MKVGDRNSPPDGCERDDMEMDKRRRAVSAALRNWIDRSNISAHWRESGDEKMAAATAKSTELAKKRYERLLNQYKKGLL